MTWNTSKYIFNATHSHVQVLVALLKIITFGKPLSFLVFFRWFPKAEVEIDTPYLSSDQEDFEW